MAEAFFISGHAGNACVKAQSVAASSEDSLFPASNLLNGRPWEPFRFGAVAANPSIGFDCNMVANSSFEVDADGTSPPSSWQAPTAGGTPDVSTAAANEGSKSLRLNAANEGAFQDVFVRPGGTYRHTVALQGDGTAIVSAYVIDLVSGKWLLSNSTWSTTKTAWATRSTASFAVSSITFTLENPVAGHTGPGKLRILFERPGSISAAAYVDSVYLWPKITCAALIFDTIPTSFTVAVQSDDNPSFSSATTHGNMPARAYRRYVTFTGPATPERFWRFMVTGTPYDLFRPWVGQTLLGERNVLTRNPARNFPFGRIMPVQGTDAVPTREGAAQRNQMRLSFRTSSAGLDEVLHRMLAASYYGVEPIFIVPRDDRDTMIYGRGKVLSQFVHEEIAEGIFEYDITIVDDRFPVETT